jgi:hypothetical protein
MVTGFFAMGAVGGTVALGVADLFEHFGLLPRLLFTAEGGAEGKREGGESERLFHGEERLRKGFGVSLQPGMDWSADLQSAPAAWGIQRKRSGSA